jgi:hypothetical protein
MNNKGVARIKLTKKQKVELQAELQEMFSNAKYVFGALPLIFKRQWGLKELAIFIMCSSTACAIYLSGIIIYTLEINGIMS